MHENSARAFGVFDLKIERFRAVDDGSRMGAERKMTGGARRMMRLGRRGAIRPEIGDRGRKGGQPGSKVLKPPAGRMLLDAARQMADVAEVVREEIASFLADGTVAS
jgi:hypothetical protein